MVFAGQSFTALIFTKSAVFVQPTGDQSASPPGLEDGSIAAAIAEEQQHDRERNARLLDHHSGLSRRSSTRILGMNLPTTGDGAIDDYEMQEFLADRQVCY